MLPALYDLTLVQYQDLVRLAQRAQPVSNDECRPPAH